MTTSEVRATAPDVLQRPPLAIPRRTVRRTMLIVAAIFCVISFTLAAIRILGGHDRVLGLTQLLDLNGEANVPAWYSSTLLFVCGLAAAAVAGRHQRGERWGWNGIALALMTMSLDETAQIHERLMLPPEYLGPYGPIHNITWVFAGTVIAGAVAGVFLRTVLAAPPRVRNGVFLAGAVYIGGAVGMEALGGLWALHHGEANIIHATIDLLEEGGELFGATLFLDAALTYLQLMGPGEVRVDPV
jgi:hypothetical protein